MTVGFIETDDFIEETLSQPLQIVYRDENFVAVFKPAGLIVHRCKATLDHEPVLLQRLRDQLQSQVYPVHRLDRPTAGLILFGLSGQAAAKMVHLFTNRQVSKYYQALVCGQAPNSGRIDTPLETFDEKDSEQSQVDPTTQQALTEYHTLARYSVPCDSRASELVGLSLLEIKPMTGRSHQIRRHLKSIGHPVIGDHRHGNMSYNQIVSSMTGVVRMLLTSMRLDFRHPYSGELQSIVVGRGSEFDLAISKINQP